MGDHRSHMITIITQTMIICHKHSKSKVQVCGFPQMHREYDALCKQQIMKTADLHLIYILQTFILCED